MSTTRYCQHGNIVYNSHVDIATLIGWFTAYQYPIIFALAIVEGPIIMTVGGFLLKLGYGSFWPLYFTLMAGDLVADTLWYNVGYHWAKPLTRKYGRFLGLTEELLAKTESAFHRHQNKILFLSKITMGLGFALVILVTAGMARVPFRKYIAFNAVGQFAWTGLLMGLGYAFGNFYLAVNEALRVMALVAFFVLLGAALYGVNKYLRAKNLEGRL